MKTKITWRRFAWFATLAVLLAITLAAIWLARDTWRRFPATEAVGAWTLVAGVGALLSGVATVGVAAFAFRGLRALTITRDEVVHRARREAKLCAIQRMEEIAKEIVPVNTTALDALAADGAQVFLGETEAVRFDPDPKDLSRANAWRATISTPTYNKIVTLLNRLEAWSVYFTSGVADDEVAFGPIAPLLRSWIGQYYAVLLILRSGTASSSGKFPNLVQLYTQWTARRDVGQLDRIHKDVAGQLEQARERLTRSRLADVVPHLEE